MNSPIFSLILTLALCPIVSRADPPRQIQTAVTDGTSEFHSGDPGLTVSDGWVELTLDDAIAIALERNLSILIQRYQHSQTLQGVGQALGIFDLGLSASLDIRESSQAPRSTLEDTVGNTLTDEDLGSNVSLSQRLPFGGELGLSLGGNKSSSSDRNIQPNPSYFANLGVTFSQPLLSGRGREITERGLIIARQQNALSRESFQQQVEEIIEQVSGSYWNLVEAHNQLRVTEESLELAKALHEMNVLREEAGVIAPLEVTRSEAEMAEREEEIIGGRARVEDNSDALRGLLNLDRGALWNTPIVPVTEPKAEVVEIDLEIALDLALANRPDVRGQRLEQDILELDLRAAHNEVKPRLDLEASWNVNALRGTFSEDDDPMAQQPEGDYLDALQALLDREFEGWGVALRFSYPLQNRSAKAAKIQSELALAQGRLALQQLEQGVMIEVRRAVREVQTAALQIQSAARSRDLAQKTLEVEQLSYRSGQSTGYDILQSQERLRDARSREASTITAYRRSLTSYYRSIGQLLEEHNLELAPEEEPK